MGWVLDRSIGRSGRGAMIDAGPAKLGLSFGVTSSALGSRGDGGIGVGCREIGMGRAAGIDGAGGTGVGAWDAGGRALEEGTGVGSSTEAGRPLGGGTGVGA